MKDVLPMCSLSQPFFHRQLNDVNAGMRSSQYNRDRIVGTSQSNWTALYCMKSIIRLSNTKEANVGNVGGR